MSYDIEEFFHDHLADIKDAETLLARLSNALEQPRCEKFKYAFLHAILNSDHDTTVDKIKEVFDILEGDEGGDLRSFEYRKHGATISVIFRDEED